VFWSGLAGIWCGHLPQPSQCWTNIWSWFSDFENFVLLHWHHDGSLKPQRILTSFHMHSQYRAVGISWWGYRSAWLISSWRSAHLINFSCVRHKSGTAARISLRFGVEAYNVHDRGLKGRWSWLNDFCSKYGYFKYLRLMNFILNGISISVLVWVSWNLVWALATAFPVLDKHPVMVQWFWKLCSASLTSWWISETTEDLDFISHA